MDSRDKRARGSDRASAVATAPPRRKSGNAGQRRRTQKRSAPQKTASDVVYTQPGPFNRNRMLLRLGTVVAVVLVMIFAISIFFKVETVTVSGNNKYQSSQILEASGIKLKGNLLGINKSKIAGNILSELPYISSVRVGIKLPDTVKIEVVEIVAVYSVQADDGSWWFMRADGVVVEKTNEAEAERHTKISGVRITTPEIGKKAEPAQPVSDATSPDGEPLPAAVSAVDQLNAVISILQTAEQNSILGKFTGVNVSNLTDLQLQYGDNYLVRLGDSTDLQKKISTMKGLIDQELGEHQRGTIDVSFTVKPIGIFEPIE